MGINKFTSTFPVGKEVKLKSLKGQHMVIDASARLYRAANGMSQSQELTNTKGEETSYINTLLLGDILKFKAAGIHQYWVFDYFEAPSQEFHVQLKTSEIEKRRLKKQEARAKVAELERKKAELESTYDGAEDEKTTEQIKECILAIDKHAKRANTLKKKHITDLKFMLNSLDIPWATAPRGYEAEQICAMLTRTDRIFGVLMDCVLTQDADALVFGARKIIRHDVRKKKYFEFSLAEILLKYELSMDSLIKISLILGWESVPKTPKIGPKTVLKKYQDIELSAAQQCAFEFFHTKFPEVVEPAKNIGLSAFSDIQKYQQMLDWLESEKCYNRARIHTQFTKNGLFLNE